jgi:parallel beta-helix repeat protein
LYDHCDITDNAGKGLNFYQCKNTVRHCNITGNRDGIFLNEKDAACTIQDNNIHDNTGMDLRLGDFHAEDVTLKGNWWGTPEASLIARKVWDREDDPNIGKAVIEPAKAEVIGTGIDGVELVVKWKFKTGGFVDCSPAISDGIVYFGSWDKNFYALNEKTGEPVWSFQTGDCVDSSPAVSEGKVFFGSWDRNIYCLDKMDGKLIWKFEMPPSNFDDHRQASPIVHSYFVIVGGFDGMMYGLSINSGNPLWGFKTGASIRSKACIGSPYSLNDEFEQNRNPPIKYKDGFIGSEDGNLYSFKLDKGKIYWKYSVGEKITSSPIRSRKGFIYIGSQKGTLFCISERDGKKVWDYQTGGRIEYSSPLITENLVLIGDCNGTLHAVNKDTGKLVWKFTGGGGIYSSPQMVKDRVVYGDNAGNVYCLDLKTGRPLGHFRAGDAVQGLSTGPDGTIYAGSRDGYLYALSLSH